jgi:hypothetical protein
MSKIYGGRDFPDRTAGDRNTGVETERERERDKAKWYKIEDSKSNGPPL